jgi:hypothetical protein
VKKQGLTLAELTSFAVNATKLLRTLVLRQRQSNIKRKANNRVFWLGFNFTKIITKKTLFSKITVKEQQKMLKTNNGGNFIGQYFRQYIKQTKFDRKVLVRRLGFNYSDNQKAVCDYMNKKDYLWWEYEVKDWCEALGIMPSMPIYNKLIQKAGNRVKW